VNGAETKKECVVIAEVTPYHVFSVSKFFRELDYDEEARKYYRYMSSRNAFEFACNVFRLVCHLTLNNVLWILFKRYLVIVIAKDIKSRRVVGICHVNVFRDKGTDEIIGHYGIAVTKEHRGRGLAKMLSLVAFSIAKKN